MKKTFWIMTILVLSFPVFSQAMHPCAVVPEGEPDCNPLHEMRDRKNVQEKRDEVRTNVQERRETVKDSLQERRVETKERMETRREELKDRLEEKREQIKDRLEKHREELKNKLKEFRDQKKAQITERVQKNLTALKERMITHFTNVLDRLENILERIVSRTDKAEQNGRDVSAVRSAITAAEAAIAAARAAVEAQAGKTYPVEVDEEATVRSDTGEARQSLHADLRVVHQAVVSAREAVRKAATALAKIPRVNDEPTATSTASENSSTDTND